MSNRTAIANAADSIQQKAVADANAIQDAVNLVAVVGCFHRRLLALHRSGVCGDDLINHPDSLAFTSKMNSLCRMSLDREIAVVSAIDLWLPAGCPTCSRTEPPGWDFVPCAVARRETPA
jgi:hypothetical protein